MPLAMSQVWLVLGPPGCGKTSWIRDQLVRHPGPCVYWRLQGPSFDNLEQGLDGGIDGAWLKDQIPELQIPTGQLSELSIDDGLLREKELLMVVEVQQFQAAVSTCAEDIHPMISKQLENVHLKPDRIVTFGVDSYLPNQDTLNFTTLEALDIDLQDSIWDPNSLSSFWFELVNGAYGDVYRAKALVNLPDGRCFFCNWIVSQDGSQFLPLERVEPPNGRPKRLSRLVVQGRALNPTGIRSTVEECLFSDEVLELHQAPLRETNNNLQPSR